jgi:uncharacterized protein YwgA
MPRPNEQKSDLEKVADIIRDAGGRIVGRTRLQKLAYLLELSGLGGGFPFEYRHYGPYSEELSTATRNAALLGLLKEEEHATNWGGFYSIYTTLATSDLPPSSGRYQLAHQAASADPIQLELAATAAFLATEGMGDPWEMTEKLKPEKSEGGNIQKAKLLYQKLARIDTPQSLPNII